MSLVQTHGWRTRWIPATLLAALTVAGCAGIEPYEPLNHREEGPEKGIFTGAKGEFVILKKVAEPDLAPGVQAQSGEVEGPGRSEVDGD